MPFVQRQSGFTKHSKFGNFKCNNYFGFVIILGQTLVTMNFDYLIKIIKDEMMTALTYLCHPVKNTKIFILQESTKPWFCHYICMRVHF